MLVDREGLFCWGWSIVRSLGALFLCSVVVFVCPDVSLFGAVVVTDVFVGEVGIVYQLCTHASLGAHAYFLSRSRGNGKPPAGEGHAYEDVARKRQNRCSRCITFCVL